MTETEENINLYKSLIQQSFKHTEGEKWWILLAVGIGTLMSALDGSVVNIILPTLQLNFQSNIAAIEWVVTIYLLVLSSLLLTFGRLGDLYDHRRIYIFGYLIFISSSILCGLSKSILMLIVLRAIQASGGAMLAANGPAIITKSFPAMQRGQALGISATMTYLGLTIGPSLGGWLTDQFSWRAVFYINLPVGLLALCLSALFIPKYKTELPTAKFDLRGAFLFMLSLIIFLLVLNQGHSWGWFSLPSVFLTGFSWSTLGYFIYLERRIQHPMLDLTLFKHPVFTFSVLSAVLNYIAVYCVIFLMPFYLIQGKGLLSSQAGLLLTSMPASMAVVAPISGTLSDKVGTRPLTFLGMLLLSLGCLLLSKQSIDSPIINIALCLVITGIGIGTFISPNNSALMGSAPSHRQGISAGILATARNLGMVLGVGLAGAILSTIISQQTQSSVIILIKAIQTNFIIAAFFAIIGALLSLVRPKSIITEVQNEK